MTVPLNWSHRVTEVPDGGLNARQEATPAQRAAVAQALDIVGCEELKADYTVRGLGQGRYTMTGRLSARLTQRCVVTLDPIAARLKEDFEVAFWPAGSLPDVGEDEVEALSLPEIEPIQNGVIEVGRVLYDILAAALDPYPRKDDARFDWEEDDGGDVAENPFAALKKLKGEG
jgi:uncharacterized metal-binding protein YceD (DUF177 family)